jgi:hypothetical protein
MLSTPINYPIFALFYPLLRNTLYSGAFFLLPYLTYYKTIYIIFLNLKRLLKLYANCDIITALFSHIEEGYFAAAI